MELTRKVTTLGNQYKFHSQIIGAVCCSYLATKTYKGKWRDFRHLQPKLQWKGGDGRICGMNEWPWTVVDDVLMGTETEL